MFYINYIKAHKWHIYCSYFTIVHQWNQIRSFGVAGIYIKMIMTMIITPAWQVLILLHYKWIVYLNMNSKRT